MRLQSYTNLAKSNPSDIQPLKACVGLRKIFFNVLYVHLKIFSLSALDFFGCMSLGKKTEFLKRKKDDGFAIVLFCTLFNMIYFAIDTPYTLQTMSCSRQSLGRNSDLSFQVKTKYCNHSRCRKCLRYPHLYIHYTQEKNN